MAKRSSGARSDSEYSYQDFVRSVEAGNISNIYVLMGEEPFLLDDALKKLEPVVLGQGLRDFNLNLFYVSDADASAIRDAVETLPMMATARMIVVKEAHELSEKDWEQLVPLIENPVPSSVLVLVASKFDKRKKTVKLLFDQSAVYNFKRPYGPQVSDWIVKLAHAQHLKFKTEAIGIFRDLVGESLQDINSELIKLAQYVGGTAAKPGLITPDIILDVASRRKVDSIFELTNAIGEGDRAAALTSLVHLLDAGESPVGIVVMVTRHIRILKAIADGLKQGITGPRLGQHAGVAPFFLNSYLGQVKRWNQRKIEQALEALADTDRALKSSPVSAHIWLENMVLTTV